MISQDSNSDKNNVYFVSYSHIVGENIVANGNIVLSTDFVITEVNHIRDIENYIAKETSVRCVIILNFRLLHHSIVLPE